MTDPFERAEKVYAALNSHAKMKSGTKMFAGSKVDVFDEAGVSRAYYSEVYDSLTASGCIEGVSLGGGRRGASIITLVRAPTRETFVSVSRRKRLTTRDSRASVLEQQLHDLNRRLPSIDLNGYIVAQEARLRGIEARLDVLEGGNRIHASQQEKSTSTEPTGGSTDGS